VVGLTLDQSPSGNIRLKTMTGYNESTLFGTGTSKAVTLNISDNGGLTASSTFTITLITSTSIQGWAHATDACNEKCNGSATTYYAVKGSASNAPTSMDIYAGNIIYTDQTQQNRLFAGTSGLFAFDGDGAEYNISNGVVGTGTQVCPIC